MPICDRFHIIQKESPVKLVCSITGFSYAFTAESTGTPCMTNACLVIVDHLIPGNFAIWLHLQR